MNNRVGQVYNHCKPFLLTYFLLLAGCVVLRLVYTRNEIFFGVNEWHGLFADRFFRLWTNLGDWLFVTLLAAVMLLFSYRKAILIATCTVSATLVGQALKMLIRFPRPPVFYKGFHDDKGQPAHIYFIPDVVILDNYSFPSGHTITALTLALLGAYFMPKKWLAPVWVVLAALLAFSRMYLKQHFFEDTVAGSAVGVVVTFIMLCLVDAKPLLQGKNGDRGLLSGS